MEQYKQNLERNDLSHVDDLLNPKPLHLETGISRLENGTLVVSVRTDLHGCKGKMLDWWFKFFETTQHINWWHPLDHVSHDGWDKYWIKGKNYIGATIHAQEKLGDIPSVPATLKFHDPHEIFTPNTYDKAIENGYCSASIYANISFGLNPKIDENGDPKSGKMFHVVRDTSYGAVLRSRFFLGLDGEYIKDEIGLGLLEHCYSEFSYLSKFLPSLYYGERVEVAPKLW
eukprot:gene1155-1465_t